ncbi:hypothetical protein BJ138DRAFT_1163784 [Hygrophoropsis aurantiaca]|uniref:Uncharacterized protein n=1 Tax=Hygrophoropsis aurantiaca TaxID=72124 RepID=A0ACB7ZZZ9_9AGAM|nr:hypothetical protein BJ138DRAFT_1163784 [Hygrophoropsis aurantiaca]
MVYRPYWELILIRPSTLVTRTGAQALASPTTTPLDTSENTDMGRGVVEVRQDFGPTINSHFAPGPEKFPPPTTTVQSTTSESSIALAPTISSPQGQMTSGSHPITSQSHTPPLGIIAGSAAAGAAVLSAAIFVVLCVVRRRARRRNGVKRAYDDNDTARSGSSSSSQANLETSHEHEALVVIPVDHEARLISTAPVPPSTPAVLLPTTSITPPVPLSIMLSATAPTPSLHTPTAYVNSYLDLNQYPDPYSYLQRDPHRWHHSDCCSEHDPRTPCPAYSCISLSENNCTIGSASLRSVGSNSSRWNGRDGREGREGEEEGRSDGGAGRTRVGSTSRSRGGIIARRTNIPPRSTSARMWMAPSDRSNEISPPSYDLVSGRPLMHQ